MVTPVCFSFAEMNALALKGGTNQANQSVADRMIPVEPAYININLAMSNSFALISPDLPLPARMEVSACGAGV